MIDNGNHLLLSGNHAALAYLRTIGARASSRPGPAAPNFRSSISRPTNAGCCVRMKAAFRGGFSMPRAACPARAPRDYLSVLPLLWSASGETIADVMNCNTALYKRLWQPVLLAALNTDPKEASARLAAAIMRETLLAGGRACRPLIAREGLSTAFVDPALAYLQASGRNDPFRTSAARACRSKAQRVAALDFGDDSVKLGAGRRRHSCRPAAGRRLAAARSETTDGIPRHRQCAFPRRAARRLSADHRRRQRPGGMDFRLPRPAVRDDQRRRPAARNAP